MNKSSHIVRFSDGSAELREPLRPTETTIDLSRLLSALRRRRKAIILSVLFWSMLGLFYAFTTPRYYDATAQIMLDSNISRTLQQVSTATETTITDSVMESARLVISSEEIVARVVDTLDLVNNNSFRNPPASATGRILGFVMSSARAPVVWLRQQVEQMTGMEPDGVGALMTQPTEEEITALYRAAAISHLQQEVVVLRVGRSSAFSISYRSHDPQLAAAVVNAFAEIYASDALNAILGATERMTEWMQTRLGVLDASARAAARAAETFRTQNGLVTTNHSTMSQDAVTALNSDLSTAISAEAQARARVAALETVISQGVDALVAEGIPAGLPAIENADLQRLQADLTGAIASLDRVRRNGTADISAVQSWEDRVRLSAESLFSAIRLQLEQARGDAFLQAARVQALRETLEQAVGTDAQMGSALVELGALEDRAATLSTLYQNFLERSQQVEQENSFPVSNVRILNSAQVPLFASGPSAKRALALCIIVGLMMGLIISAIREYRDRFLYTAEQVTEEVGTHFLGYLPEMPTSNAMIAWRHARTLRGRQAQSAPTDAAAPGGPETVPAPPSRALEASRSPYAETLRSIRLSSQIVGSRGKGRVIGITSARPNEGKTDTSYNFAASIAAVGHSVLLIDADPHRCGLSQFLDIKGDDGLLQVLSGNKTWKNACKRLGNTGVIVIPSEVRPEFTHTHEMLSSAAFSQLIQDSIKVFDFVILDLAPMGAVADVRAVIDDVDQLIAVAEWGKTSKLLLHRLLTSDRRVADKILGVVLTRVDLRRLKHYASEGDKASYSDEYGSYYA